MSRGNKKDWDLGTLLSVIGFVFELVRVTVNALRKRDGTVDHLRRLLNDSKLVDQVFDLIVGAAKKAASAFTVVVDYTKSLADMIAAGRYDRQNDNITAKHFLVSGSGQVTVGLELVHFGKDMSTEDVLVELDKRNLRPATLPELLAFGAKYPDEQRKYPIIALGSVWSDWSGGRSVVCLAGRAGGRGLNLRYSDRGWNDQCCFLAASK